MQTEIKNAQIISTYLGREDHGIPTAHIQLQYDGSIQGFGGYVLRSNDAVWKFIDGVLTTVDVYQWENLVGKFVRVEAEYTKIHRIGHIIKDVWFDPKSIYL